MTLRSLHHPTTRAALNLPGLCPVCGDSASRKVVWENGSARETYRCPVDGETEYAQGTPYRIRVTGLPRDAGLSPAVDGFVPLAALAGA